MWIKDKAKRPNICEFVLIAVGDAPADPDYLVGCYGIGVVDNVEVGIFETCNGEVFEFHEVYAWMRFPDVK